MYSNHVDALNVQCDRMPRPFPKIHVKRDVKDIQDFKIEDFEITGYDPYPKITMEMSV